MSKTVLVAVVMVIALGSAGLVARASHKAAATVENAPADLFLKLTRDRLHAQILAARDAPQLQVPSTETDPEALRRASHLVDEGLARKVWEDEQATTFHGLLFQLSESDRAVLLGKLVTAINSGQLDVHTQGMPF